jgi:YfiH family protein
MTTLPTDPTPNQLPLYVSRLLQAAGFSHAFFTRRGGVSPAPFDSLDLSTNDPLRAAEFDANVRIVAAALGVDSSRLFMPNQVHGVDAVVVTGTEEAGEVRKCEADTVLGSRWDVACAIRTADCVPVLLGCRASGLAAACHAGWKGCVEGAIPAAVEALRAAGGTDIIAAIGPHISVAAFEVAEDVAEQLAAASPATDVIERRGEKLHVDLRKIARAQLLQSGLAPEAIDDVLGCTVLEPETFFSFRRDGALSGRQISAIVPRAAAR